MKLKIITVEEFGIHMQHIPSLITLQVLKEASRLYAASCVLDIDPELRPNDYKKGEETGDKPGDLEVQLKKKNLPHWRILVRNSYLTLLD